jgi:hypothetical protein
VDRGSKYRKIALILIGVVILIGIIVALFVGLSSLKKFLTIVMVIIGACGIIFLLAYVFWLLFIKVEFKDIPAQWRKKLEVAAKMMQNDMLGKLYLSGDEKHNRICLGKYLYLRVNMPKITKLPVIDKKGNPQLDDWERPITKEETEDLPIDIFIVEQKGFFKKLFNDPIFILTFPKSHDFSSIVNDVIIKGFNLVPLDNYFYTIDKHNLDLDMTKAIATNYMKEAVFEQLRDLDKLIKGAINLDSRFYKEKEKSSEFEIPQLEKMKGN